ncbi:FAD-dependent oxidoreductase [Haloarculaceae archaeon H-GB1-1]|nr:FAD-dependent oxidoreductase [Haloarculaceae archaeon H-GB1-1]
MADHVAVVGAGAVGVTAAVDLASGGASVTLFDRDEPGSGASGRAAGIVYDAFADRRDAQIAQRALERFFELADRDAIDLVRTPYVWLARDGDERRADAIREQVPRMREHGCRVSLLDPAALGERFPTLETDDVVVAAVAENAGVLSPETYVETMAARARVAGVTLRPNVEVSVREGGVVETSDGTESFDAVLVAAGAHTKRVLADAGVPIPMKPYRVQALVTEQFPDVPTLYDASGEYYLRPKGGGLLVGDGTEPVEADPDDYDRSGDAAFESDAVASVERATGIEPEIRRSWAGLCTATPDRDPLLGRVDDGLYVATGWHGHGFMRAPALGEAVAAEIRGGVGIPSFDPGRFDGDESFEVVEGMAIE